MFEKLVFGCLIGSMQTLPHSDGQAQGKLCRALKHNDGEGDGPEDPPPKRGRGRGNGGKGKGRGKGRGKGKETSSTPASRQKRSRSQRTEPAGASEPQPKRRARKNAPNPPVEAAPSHRNTPDSGLQGQEDKREARETRNIP